MSLAEIMDCLEKEGAVLVREKNAAPLRNVQRFLWHWQESAPEDEDTRFMIFFLDSFVERVFFDLTGDVPFVEGVTAHIQRTLYHSIGTAFLGLSNTLKMHGEQKNTNELYKQYVQLGLSYLNAVRSLNKEL